MVTRYLFWKALVASLDKNQEYFKEPIDFQKLKAKITRRIDGYEV